MKRKYTKTFETKPTGEMILNTISEATKELKGKYLTHYLDTNGTIYLLDIRVII